MFASSRPKPILVTGTEPEQRTRSSGQLAKIAAALKVSVGSFLDEPSRPASPTQQSSVDPRDALELLGLYEAITNPEARRACLAYMRAAAERSDA